MMAMLIFSFSCDHRRQLAHGHLESAVADHDPDFGFRPRHLGADRRGQREAHGSQAAGGNQRARLFVLVVLRFPHLVLAHVGHDHGIAVASLAPQIVDDVRGVEMSVVGKLLNVAHRGVAL